MNSDFRVLVTLPTHPKTKKLMRQLGDRAFYNLIRLWAWVAQNKPEGELTNMDKDDIEIAADWQGDEGLFVDTLIDLTLIDCENGVCLIHDWTENNGYASAAAKRSKKARLAAKARWDKRLESDANECSEQCLDVLEHDSSNAPSPNPSPDPNPKPSPKPRAKKFVPPSRDDAIEYFLANDYSQEAAIRFVKYYEAGNPPWHDSKGNPVRSWKQKARAVWFKDENRVQSSPGLRVVTGNEYAD